MHTREPLRASYANIRVPCSSVWSGTDLQEGECLPLVVAFSCWRGQREPGAAFTRAPLASTPCSRNNSSFSSCLSTGSFLYLFALSCRGAKLDRSAHSAPWES